MSDGPVLQWASFHVTQPVAICNPPSRLARVLNLEADLFVLGAQVLVFSHKVRMLRIIQKMMTAKGYAYLVLDGSTPQVSRKPAEMLCSTPST